MSDLSWTRPQMYQKHCKNQRVDVIHLLLLTNNLSKMPKNTTRMQTSNNHTPNRKVIQVSKITVRWQTSTWSYRPPSASQIGQWNTNNSLEITSKVKKHMWCVFCSGMTFGWSKSTTSNILDKLGILKHDIIHEQKYSGNSLNGRLHNETEPMRSLRITAKTDAPQMIISDFPNKTHCESSDLL